MKYLLPIFILISVVIGASAQTQLTNIPTVFINTVNNQSLTEKDLQIDAFLTLLSDDETETLQDDTITIKGRGNSTWKLATKP